MRFTQHPSNNGVLGAPKGHDQSPLPITHTVAHGMPCMVSFWKPDAAELAALANGGTVALWVMGAMHPMVALGVEPRARSVVEPKCSDHPDAPHGFNRTASHSLGRYVCDCEGWVPHDL